MQPFRLIKVLIEAIRAYGADEGPLMAAAIAYYGLFSFVPLLLVIISVISYVVPPVVLQHQLMVLTGAYLPVSARLIEQLVEQLFVLRDQLGLVGLLVLTWAASGVFMAINYSLNRIWGWGGCGRPALHNRLLALGTVVFLGLFVFLSVASSTVFRYLGAVELTAADAPNLAQTFLWQMVVMGLPYIFTFLVFLFAYRLVPDAKTPWTDIWSGALIGSLLFELGKHAFTWYVTTLSRYHLFWGSVGTVIVLLLWIYFSASMLLFGAEVASTNCKVREGKIDLDAAIIEGANGFLNRDWRGEQNKKQ